MKIKKCRYSQDTPNNNLYALKQSQTVLST